MSAKCPKCGESFMSFTVETMQAIDLTIGSSDKFCGLVCKCPLCDTVISCGINPFILKDLIVSEVVEKLKTP